MKIKIHLIATFMIFGSALQSTSSLAETRRSRCENVAQLAYMLATERDKGVSQEEMGQRINSMRASGALSDADYYSSLLIAGLVYIQNKNKTPSQIKNSFKKCE